MPGCLQLFKLKLNCFKFSPQSSVQKSLTISVPSISQKDHVRLAEWLKSEWQEHLNLKTEIQQIETKIFYQKANNGELDIYRRSIPLTELHCDHAKDTLLKLPEFKGLSYKSCSDFFQKALQSYLWIPLGLVHLSHLHNDKFEGYYINLLDQFGLENLKRTALNE